MLVPRAISSSMSISSASVLGASSTGINGHASRARPRSAPVAAKTRPRWRIAAASTTGVAVSSRRKARRRTAIVRAPRRSRTLRKARGEHRHQGQRHQQRAGQGEDHHQGQGLEERAAGRAGEDHRQEDHAGGQGRGDDGAGDLAGPDPRRLLGRQPAFLALADDALEHDDGAVDDEADAEGEPAEGHLVEGHAAEEEEPAGRDHRDRDRQRDDAGRRPAAEEEVEHENGEQRAPQRRAAHAVDGLADELALVADHGEVDIVALIVDPLHLAPHRGRHRHRVGAALLLDPDADRGDAVHLHQVADVLVAVAHGGDVADPDRLAERARDDGSGHRLDRWVLAEGADVEIVGAALDVSGRQRDVLPEQRLLHIEGGQTGGAQPVAVEIDADLAPDSAADGDRTDPGDLFETPRQVVLEETSEPLEIAGRGGGQADDLDHVEIELEDLRRLGLDGKLVAQPVEGGAQVVGRLVDVGAPREAQADPARALLRLRGDALEIRQTRDRVLDGIGDDLLDLLGADVGVAAPARSAR